MRYLRVITSSSSSALLKSVYCFSFQPCNKNKIKSKTCKKNIVEETRKRKKLKEKKKLTETTKTNTTWWLLMRESVIGTKVPVRPGWSKLIDLDRWLYRWIGKQSTVGCLADNEHLKIFSDKFWLKKKIRSNH